MTNYPDQITYPSDYILTTLTINSYNGISVDIRSNMIEFVLHENLYSPFLFGHILVGENVNLIRYVPFIGNETLDVEYVTPSRDRSIKQRFFIYKIGEKVDLDPSYKSNTYKLYFSSEAFINCNKQKISRSFSNLTYSDMVKMIYADTFGSSKPILAEETLGKKHIVLPFSKPHDAIDLISKKCISKDGYDYSYLFYETTDQFNFLPINYASKLNYTPQVEYMYFPANVTNPKGYFKDLNVDMKRIESYEILSLNNTLKNITNGVFSSNILTHDITYKTIKNTTFSYNNDYYTMNHVEENGILPNNGDTFSDKNMSYYCYYPKHSYLYNGIQDSDEYEYTVLKRVSSLSHYDNFRISAVVAGDTNRKVGELVIVNILSGEAQKNINDNPFDYYLSGLYIISKITHILQKEQYKLRIEFERDSIPNPYPETKAFK